MKPKRQDVGAYQYRDDELEMQINDAKGWIDESNSEARRKEFRHMADLIAKRSPEYIAELEAQMFGYYL